MDLASKNLEVCTRTVAKVVELEVLRRGRRRVRRHRDAVHHEHVPVHARQPDVDGPRARAAAAGELEVVVVLARGLQPAAAAAAADLELLDPLGRVDDLHGEPVLGGPGLGVQLQGRADGAAHVRPADGDDALGRVGELLEGVREEVKVVQAAAGTLVDDLGRGSAEALPSSEADPGEAGSIRELRRNEPWL